MAPRSSCSDGLRRVEGHQNNYFEGPYAANGLTGTNSLITALPALEKRRDQAVGAGQSIGCVWPLEVVVLMAFDSAISRLLIGLLASSTAGRPESTATVV